MICILHKTAIGSDLDGGNIGKPKNVDFRVHDQDMAIYEQKTN